MGIRRQQGGTKPKIQAKSIFPSINLTLIPTKNLGLGAGGGGGAGGVAVPPMVVSRCTCLGVPAPEE